MFKFSNEERAGKAAARCSRQSRSSVWSTLSDTAKDRRLVRVRTAGSQTRWPTQSLTRRNQKNRYQEHEEMARGVGEWSRRHDKNHDQESPWILDRPNAEGLVKREGQQRIPWNDWNAAAATARSLWKKGREIPNSEEEEDIPPRQEALELDHLPTAGKERAKTETVTTLARLITNKLTDWKLRIRYTVKEVRDKHEERADLMKPILKMDCDFKLGQGRQPGFSNCKVYWSSPPSSITKANLFRYLKLSLHARLNRLLAWAMKHRKKGECNSK